MLQPRMPGTCSLLLLPLLTVPGQHSRAMSMGPAGPPPAPALRSISRGSSQQPAAPRLKQVRLMLLPEHTCLLACLVSVT